MMMMKKKSNDMTMAERKKAGLVRDTKGLSTVEYLIILVVIAVAGISLWQDIGKTVDQKATESNTDLQTL